MSTSKIPLPADLPEDWEVGQIVSPAGTDVGLTTQHGYNYQSKQINDTQEAVNEMSEIVAALQSQSFIVSDSEPEDGTLLWFDTSN